MNRRDYAYTPPATAQATRSSPWPLFWALTLMAVLTVALHIAGRL